MDAPGEQQRLNREIWEATRGTSYDEALQHISAVRDTASSAASATVELPTGWSIGPAGTQIAVGTFPFAAALYGNKIVTVDSGYSSSTQTVSVVDPTSGTTINTLTFQNLFPSLTPALGGDLLISGGQSNLIYRYNSSFQEVQTYSLPGYAAGVAPIDDTHFAALYSEVSGVGISRPGHLVVIDASTGATQGDALLGSFEAYSVSNVDGKLYVTIPASNSVLVFDTALNQLASIPVGATPLNACSYGRYLYVINSNSDSISVISSATDQVRATFDVRFPNSNQPFGAAATACSVDAGTIYVTFAQTNSVGLFDRTTGASKGYIPTGWYPTAIVSNDNLLAVVSPKGIRPRRPNPDGTYVLTLLQGSVGVIRKSQIAENLNSRVRQALALTNGRAA